MDTKDLLAARDKLQSDMRETLANLAGKFEIDSGIGVSGIDVEFIDVTCAGHGRRVIISHVSVKLEIE